MASTASNLDLTNLLERTRLKCPDCGGTCTRHEWAGTPAIRRVNVDCNYCPFTQLVAIPTDGGAPYCIEPDPPDRGHHHSIKDAAKVRRSRCVYKGCNRLADEAGLCEQHLSAWRVAGRPEPIKHWAQAHAALRAADRKRGTATIVTHRPTTTAEPPPESPSPPEAPEPTTPTPATPTPAPAGDDDMEVDMPTDPYHTLTRGDKARFTRASKVKKELTVGQWINDGKPSAKDYAKRARTTKTKPAPPQEQQLPPLRLANPANVPSTTAPREVKGELLTTSGGDNLIDLATSLIDVAAKSGGRCRVVILDLELGK